MTCVSTELIALRAKLIAAYDEADRWRDKAASGPHCDAQKLAIAHVRKMSQAYCSFRTALAKLETGQ